MPFRRRVSAWLSCRRSAHIRLLQRRPRLDELNGEHRRSTFTFCELEQLLRDFSNVRSMKMPRANFRTNRQQPSRAMPASSRRYIHRSLKLPCFAKDLHHQSRRWIPQHDAFSGSFRQVRRYGVYTWLPSVQLRLCPESKQGRHFDNSERDRIWVEGTRITTLREENIQEASDQGESPLNYRRDLRVSTNAEKPNLANSDNIDTVYTAAHARQNPSHDLDYHNFQPAIGSGPGCSFRTELFRSTSSRMAAWPATLDHRENEPQETLVVESLASGRVAAQDRLVAARSETLSPGGVSMDAMADHHNPPAPEREHEISSICTSTLPDSLTESREMAPSTFKFQKPTDDKEIFWSHRLYRNANGETPKIHYCTTYEQAEQQARLFNGSPVIGFDLEWEMGANTTKSPIKWNVSLIQIANEERIGLFHIASFRGDTVEELMPPSLRALLESSAVTKAGVNISGDATRLRGCLDVDIKGLFELSHMYKVVRYSESQPSLVNRRVLNMAAQVKDVFGLPLLKENGVRMSSWSRRLNMEQTEYAAADAYAGLRLYLSLDEERLKMSPTPPRPAHYELFRGLVLGNGDVVEYKPTKKKRVVASGKATVVEDSADEEFFDALEEQEIEDCEESTPNPNTTESNVSALPTTETKTETPRKTPKPHVHKDNASPAPTFTASLPIRSTPTSPHLVQARQWISQWRSNDNVHRTRVSDRQIEIWHMWHHQSLDLSTIATIARDPPLSQVTVVSYVVTVVKDAELPYDVERMREAFKILPTSIHGRYSSIWNKIRK